MRSSEAVCPRNRALANTRLTSRSQARACSMASGASMSIISTLASQPSLASALRSSRASLWSDHSSDSYKIPMVGILVSGVMLAFDTVETLQDTIL